MRRPLLFLAIDLAMGIAIGGETSAQTAAMLLLGAALLLCLALIAPEKAASAAAGAAALAIGAASAGIEQASYQGASLLVWVEQGADPTEPVRLFGIAREDGRYQEDTMIVVLDVIRAERQGRFHDVTGRVRIQVPGSPLPFEVLAGDRVAIWVHSLRRPRRFQAPGAWDSEAIAQREGIHALGWCKSGRLVSVLSPGNWAAPTVWAAHVRSWSKRQLRRYMIPGPEEGLLRAMTLGDRSGVDDDTAEAFRVAGTYHVLAISGAQVALLAGLAVALAARAKLSPLWTAIVVSFGIASYATLVGGDPPVTRAAVMAIALLVGRALDLDADLINLVGLAGMGLLVIHPSGLWDVGFQLSFVATLGILFLTRPLAHFIPALPLRLDRAIAVSLAAQVPIAPLLAFHFHRLAPAAVLFNLLAVPLSSAVLLVGLLLLLTAGVLPCLAPTIGDVGWIAAHALRLSGEPARLLPGLDSRTPDPTILPVAILVIGLVWLWHGRAIGLLVSVLGTIAMAVGTGGPAGDGRLHLTVLDVGQGDALVLRSPSGRIMVVDAGGPLGRRLDGGEAVVAPYLWSLGIHRFDALLLTHFHADHVAGAPTLVRGFKIDAVLEGPSPRADPVYAALGEALRQARVPRRGLCRGVRLDFDGVRLDVLEPKVKTPGLLAHNNDSIVVMVRWNRTAFLLAGDTEASAHSPLPSLRADVLKVPHHGSRGGSHLASAVHPQVAVISVGAHNRFGHPHAETLTAYRSFGCFVLRTDQDGSVTISTDGHRIWVSSTGLPEKRFR